MKLVECKCGHSYDPECFTRCPYCDEPYEEGSSEKKAKKKGLRGILKSFQKPKTKLDQPDSPNMEEHMVDPGENEQPPDPVQEASPEKKSPEEPKPNSPIGQENRGHTVRFFNTQNDEPEPEQSTAAQAFKPQDSASDFHPDEPARTESSEEPVLEDQESNRIQQETRKLEEEVRKATVGREGQTVRYYLDHMEAQENTQQEWDEPVAGWLVCIGGKHMGAFFPLYTGNNSLGRSSENDIVLGWDEQVSRRTHSIVIYEPQERVFYVKPGESHGLTYYNGAFLKDITQMKDRDIIRVGKTELMLAAFCGASFSWEDRDAQTEGTER